MFFGFFVQQISNIPLAVIHYQRIILIPVNEALRDRVQHAEKLDLPPKEVMMERVKAKTGYESEPVLSLLAETIMVLDETARANAIKGVAGMRSYIFWVDAVQSGASIQKSLYYMMTTLMPVIRELIRKTNPLLEHELSAEFAKSRLYGTKFCADQVASMDFRTFARKRPPEEEPSIAVALRIDESASMSAFGRLEAAKQAAVALYEFCTRCGIPIMVYGDTADRSKLEQMSIHAYVDFESKDADEKYALMNIQARSNNRDGMALRIISDRLLNAPQRTKLIISISDGQPKAMPDYSGEKAACDMKDTLQEFRRKGIQFLAAAIGQDKEAIRELYGAENTLDITDLRQLPARLVQIIARFM